MKLSRENLRILLVDDDETDVELLCSALHAAGFTHSLTHFRNGAIALEYFKYKKATGALVPHIILLDLNMPLIDGVRALHRLREVSSFRDLPVIILSGNEDPAIPGNDFPSDANRKNESPFQYPVPGDSDMTP